MDLHNLPSDDDYDYHTDGISSSLGDNHPKHVLISSLSNAVVSPRFSAAVQDLLLNGSSSNNFTDLAYDYDEHDLTPSSANGLLPGLVANETSSALILDQPVLVLWDAKQTFLELLAAKFYKIPIAVALGIVVGFLLWAVVVAATKVLGRAWKSCRGGGGKKGGSWKPRDDSGQAASDEALTSTYRSMKLSEDMLPPPPAAAAASVTESRPEEPDDEEASSVK